MADNEIARLKKRRGIVRTSVTKQIKSIETEFKNETISETLEESLELLSEYATELDFLDKELLKIIDANEIDADLKSSMEYKEKIVTWKFRARKKINMFSKSNISPIQSTPDSSLKNPSLETVFQDKMQIKLPKLSIQKFYGEISHWLSFWNSFESAIHNNASLDKISKFNYLKAYLSGSALHTVEGYAITAENYDSAISSLKERFGRPEILINQHISNILVIPPLKHSSDIKSFRMLYDKIVTEIRSLETLNVLPDTYSTVLCPMLLKLLPHDLIFEFNKEVQNSTYEINKLIDFLSKQLIARERSILSKNESQRNFSDRSQGQHFRIEGKNEIRKTTASDLLSSELKSNKYSTCIFCKDYHESPNDCLYALKLSVEERKNILIKRGACFRCTGNHLSKYCNKHVNCKYCNGRHLSILCFHSINKGKNETYSKTNKEKICESNVLTNNSCSKVVLLQTLIVCINENNSSHFLRIILDLGSQKSYVSRYAAEVMKLKCIGEEAVTHGLFGGIEKSEKHKKYSIKLSNIDNSFTFELEVLDQKKICTPIPKLKNFKCIQELKESGIFLSDIGINENCCLFENDPNEIHVLLGADCASKLITGEVTHLSNGMLAMKTNLGWTIIGNSGEKKSKNSNILLSLHASTFDITDYWSLDTIGIRDPGTKMVRSELEKAAKDHFLQTITRDKEGRYSVSLPWIKDHPPLSDCRNLAEKRLANCVKSLQRTGRLPDYGKVFEDWLSEDIIEEVPPSLDNKKEHFLPHRPVFKDNSMTTKVRPVFDGSAKEMNSPSLNDCVEKGPNLIELIPSLVNKFRLKKYGVISDIEKAFLQIGLCPSDRPFLKFLWWERGKRENLKIFWHKRVVFGISSSPFLLGATLEYHLDKERVPDHLQETARKIRNSFYVDNCVLSVDTPEELSRLISEAQALLSTAKFHLRGWEHTPSPLVLEKRSEVNREVPVLGLSWKLPNDTLSIDLKGLSEDEELPLTKRKILSAVHRIFDPIGFTCPITLVPKLLLQECWKNGISWDSALPEAIVKKFTRWKNELKNLNELEIPRYVLKDSSSKSDLSIHVFCDASKSAYATSIFLRIADAQKVKCQLVQARSRVAPVKTVSIPRLELLACSIAARLAHRTVSEMNLESIPIIYWSDSANAIYWIKGTENWAAFVYNRVQEIRKLSDPLNWKHVAGPLNPADLPSRGCNFHELLRTRWWEGPSWLKLPPDEWPISKIDPDLDIVNSEKRKTIVSATNVEVDAIKYTNRISSYRKIVRVMAWIQRFCYNCKNKGNRKGEKLDPEEINQAEKIVLRKVQEQSFEEERKLNLQTFSDSDGLIKVKTRISMREDLEAFRFPILLPSKHHIVDKLIFEKHIELCHSGLQVLMSNLRENFWIIKSRKTIRHVIRGCVKCKRFENHPLENVSAPLPKDRVRDALVFEVTGTDLCGPLHLKNGLKCWIVIFTCAVYRATHFELVTSLSTEDFLLALRRFISRRGRPSTIYSDNGTNLVGTANELKSVDWQRIEEFATLKKISWRLNPPSSPWWGGFWERLIGMLKRILRKVIGNACLKYEELYTILCDAESLINSRPLTYLSEEPDDLVALSPSMFLQEIREVGVPDLDLIDEKKLNKRFAYKQKIRQDLRLRFRSEYLGQLKDFTKVKKECYIREGNIVLIGDSNTKPINWPLAKVIQTFPGKDGKIRVVQVKTKNGTFLRPIQRLYPLEISSAETSPQLNVISQLQPLDDDNRVPISDTKNPDCVLKNCSQQPEIRRSRHGRILNKPDKLNL